ncbi:MAG: leucine dehydrogenase, partial [Planctomycetes bacterium]|nr:leucine dehydrogenase [Planctomycetota bacterium]
LGHVGYHLCSYLHEDGARLTVTDIDAQRVQRVVDDFGATAVGTHDIYAVDADIFAPCALGAVVDDETLKVFTVDVIAGAANNQLAEARHGEALQKKGILYAPDYVINAGGLINVYGEINEWGRDRAKRKAGDIYNTLLRIFQRADADGVPTSVAADRLAEQRLAEVRTLQKSWV